MNTAGNDASTGTTPDTAWKNPDTAASRARPGDVICFGPGTYSAGLKIEAKNGTQAQPITFKALNPSDLPTFTLGNIREGGSRGAVYVKDSSHIQLQDYIATNSMRGTYIDSSNNILVERCRLHGVGQEGIHIGFGTNASLPVSSFVTVRDCEIYNGGNIPGERTNPPTNAPKDNSILGELVYVGSGGKPGDTTNNVLIENNIIRDNAPATAEAVNVKTGTFNITVRNNHIYNIDSWCEAAIRSNSSNNLKVIGNVVHDITASGTGGGPAYNNCTNATALRFSAKNVEVRDNIIWNTPRNGIRAESGSSGVVENNTVMGGGQNDLLNEGSATFRNNVSGDGKEGSAKRVLGDFIGPFSGGADAGQGPGSGFILKSGGSIGSQLYQ